MSFLLDTTVIFEAMKPEPNPAVQAWAERTDSSLLHLSVVTLGEIRLDMQLLPQGVHRRRLARWLKNELPRQFAGRILAVDHAVADAAGRLAAKGRRRGITVDRADAWIAATAAVHGLTLVRQNTGDFRWSGLRLLDPFR